MNNKCILVLIFILSLYTSVYSQIKNKANYKYLLYLPKDYSAKTKKYPLVIYLHGGSQRGNDLNQLKAYGLPLLVDKGANYHFIIASPQCPDGKYWTTENWFDSLYLDLSTKYRIDTNRIYVTGISIGGYGAYTVAMDFPNKFAAIVALCGGCNDKDTNRICSLNKIPIWAFHGTADTIISIKETERVYLALKKCNGKIKFTKLKGKFHNIQFVYENNRRIYKWMLRQKKNTIIE